MTWTEKPTVKLFKELFRLVQIFDYKDAFLWKFEGGMIMGKCPSADDPIGVAAIIKGT